MVPNVADVKERAENLIRWAWSHRHNSEVGDGFRTSRGSGLGTVPGIIINRQVELWEEDDEMEGHDWGVFIKGQRLCTVSSWHGKFRISGISTAGEYHAFVGVLDDIEECKRKREDAYFKKIQQETQERQKVIKMFNDERIPEAREVKPLQIGVGQSTNNPWGIWLVIGIVLVILTVGFTIIFG